MSNSRSPSQYPQQPGHAAPPHSPQHEEHLLDEALEQTFPASDPVAELPEPPAIDEEEAIVECELDLALEMTFPASDPIAVSTLYRPDIAHGLHPAHHRYHECDPDAVENPHENS